MAENFTSLNGIPPAPISFFALSDLTILFISSIEAGGMSKLKDFGKTFSFMVKTMRWFL